MENIIKVRIEGLPSSGKSAIENIIVKALIAANKNKSLANFEHIQIFGIDNFMPTNNFINNGNDILLETGEITEESIKYLKRCKS